MPCPVGSSVQRKCRRAQERENRRASGNYPRRQARSPKVSLSISTRPRSKVSSDNRSGDIPRLGAVAEPSATTAIVRVRLNGITTWAHAANRSSNALRWARQAIRKGKHATSAPPAPKQPEPEKVDAEPLQAQHATAHKKRAELSRLAARGKPGTCDRPHHRISSPYADRD